MKTYPRGPRLSFAQDDRDGWSLVALQVAIVADIDAARIGGEVQGTQKKDGDSCEGPEEKLHGKGG